VSATDDKRAIAAAETAAKAAVNTASHGRSRPRRRRKRRAGRGHGIDVADNDGATIALPPTTTVRSTRRWWRAHRDDLSLHAPPPPKKGRLAGLEIVFPYSVVAACPTCCVVRRCLQTPVQGSSLRVRLRAVSHIPATQCCAARNPPPTSSERRSGAPAARQLLAAPPKVSAARPHCGRAPTHAKEPLGGLPPLDRTVQTWGGRTRIGRGSGCPPAKPCPARPPPAHVPTMSAACASNGICGHSRPRANEFQISRRLCDRQRNVCLSAIVPIWVFDARLDTIVDRFGSQNVRKCTNVSPNASGTVGRWKNANLLRTSAILSGWTYVWSTSGWVCRSGSRHWWDDRFSHTSAHTWQICHV